MDFAEKKKVLQLELAQLQALKSQLMQTVEEANTRIIQTTGKIELMEELEKEQAEQA